MGKSSIEWTEETWNPVRGCREVSPGCDHCYARTFAERWRGIPGHPYEAGFDPRVVPDQMTLPLRWRTPRTVFVNSMSDLFQGAFADDVLDRVFAVMGICAMHDTLPSHIFQVLTKRAPRMRVYLRTNPAQLRARFARIAGQIMEDGDGWHDSMLRMPWPLPNLWQGVSVESAEYLHRIDLLRDVPAHVRFLSLEPLLGDLGRLNLTGIHWVIVGGESGPGARPCQLEWVESIRHQCKEQGAAFFMKQAGAKPTHEGRPLLQLGRKGGELGRLPAHLTHLNERVFPS